MIDTAGTLCAGGVSLMEHGATRVFACATHPVFSGPALERLEHSVFEKVVVTDTIPINPLHRPDKDPGAVGGPRSWLMIICNVFTDDSVSGLFHGGNQLF